VTNIERETFESSLRAGRRALESLGVVPYEARERADRFRLHNVAVLEDLLPHLADEKLRFSIARAGRQQLEEQFAQDQAALDEWGREGWHSETNEETEGR
jgi:glutathione-regulated potassium-efflux system ancillary protein KefC